MSRKKDHAEDAGVNFGFGGIFKGIENLVNLVNEMNEAGKTEISRTGEITGTDNKGIRAVYGFTVKMGHKGNHQVQPFGNIKKKENRIVVQEVREPMADLFDEGDNLRLIIELPGVRQEDVNLDIKNDIVVISANSPDRKYAKEIFLPFPVNPDTVETFFNLGVLEIRLAREQV